MAVCNETLLPNLGSGSCDLVQGEQKRVFPTSTKKEDGTLNKMLLTDAPTLANWQILFDKPNFSDSALEKVVPTDIVFETKQENGEPVNFDQGGFFKKLANGDAKITFVVYDKVAQYVKKMYEMADKNLSIYLGDDKNQMGGKKDGLYLVPIKVQTMSVTPFTIANREAPATSTVTIQLKNPLDMNDFWMVEVTDGDMSEDSDFYSLNDVNTTISIPATTGCVAALATDRYGVAVSGLVYTDFNFYDAIAPAVAIPLTASTELTESPDGTYTINKASLLTLGHTYTLKITGDTYDIATGKVVVPGA